MTWNTDDEVWLQLDGTWTLGRVRTSCERSTQVRVSLGTEWRGTPYLVLESALGYAIAATAAARTAVVEAARAFQAGDWLDRDQEECDVENTVVDLLRAERAEAEARAALGAL